MRIEGYDRERQAREAFRRWFPAQKIEGRWFLKQMRIEEFDPATGKVQTSDLSRDQEVTL